MQVLTRLYKIYSQLLQIALGFYYILWRLDQVYKFVLPAYDQDLKTPPR